MRTQQFVQTSTERNHDAYEALRRRCSQLSPVTAAAAYPGEQMALAGAVEAGEAKLISPILAGPAQLIREVAKQAKLNIERYPIEEAPDTWSSAAKAVELVRAARAAVLMMKGSLPTDELLGAVVSSTTGLRTGTRLSHASVMSVPTYPSR